MVCCDCCPKVYHLQCHIPPLLEVPEGIWTCCECKATHGYSFEEAFEANNNEAKRRVKARTVCDVPSSLEESTNQGEFQFLWNYYLDPVKRPKEELPGGMILRTKSVRCNLLRYSNCLFRQKLFKEIHRLRKGRKDDEVYRMLKMLYDHDISGCSGDGPAELVQQILNETKSDCDDEHQIESEIKIVEVVELVDSDAEGGDLSVKKNASGLASVKIKIESSDSEDRELMQRHTLDSQGVSLGSSESENGELVQETEKDVGRDDTEQGSSSLVNIKIEMEDE